MKGLILGVTFVFCSVSAALAVYTDPTPNPHRNYDSVEMLVFWPVVVPALFVFNTIRDTKKYTLIKKP